MQMETWSEARTERQANK